MKVEAFYKKRKQLAQYLPPEERSKLKTERKASTSSLMNTASSSPRSRLPNDVASSPSTTSKRRPSDQDSSSVDVDILNNSGGQIGALTAMSDSNGTQFDVQPPTKRSNTTENSEIANGLQVS